MAGVGVTFDRKVSKLSGPSIFQANGSLVTGSTVNTRPCSDANGSIAPGDLQGFSVPVAPYAPSGADIGMQLVINALPPALEPGTWSLMLGDVAALGTVARRAGHARTAETATCA